MKAFTQGGVPTHPPWGKLSCLAGLGCPVPSSMVSDEQTIIVGKWFRSACKHQSPRCLDQPEAGTVLGMLQPPPEDNSRLGVFNVNYFLYLENNEKKLKIAIIAQVRKLVI